MSLFCFDRLIARPSWLEIAFAHNYINALAKDSTGIMYASDASVVAITRAEDGVPFN